MTKDEALKMALEALQEIDLYPHKVLTASDEEQIDIAITVLSQVLEEPDTMTVTELAKRIKRGEKWKLAEPSEGIKRRREVVDHLEAVQRERSMTKDEALKMAQDACPYTNEELRGAFYDGFLKALDQLPDTTKIIERDKQLQLAIKRGDKAHAYAMELQKRLLKYEK